MSEPAWKIRCLRLAECIDAWRIAPRALLVAYWILVYNTTDRILSWYMALPAAERSMEASGMAFGVFTALLGLGTMFMNAYLKSGREWNVSRPDN